MHPSTVKIKKQTVSKTLRPKKTLNVSDDLLSKQFAYPKSQGNWSEVTDAFLEFLVDPKINPRVKRVVKYIYMRSIKFKDPYTLLKRSSICEATGIIKENIWRVIAQAKKDGIIFEEKQKNDTYLYALNPDYFGGLIVVKDIPPEKITIKDTEVVATTPESTRVMATTQKSHGDSSLESRRLLSPKKNSPQVIETTTENGQPEKPSMTPSLEDPCFKKTSFREGADLPEKESVGKRFTRFVGEHDQSNEVGWHHLAKQKLCGDKSELGLFLQAVRHLFETNLDFYGKPLITKPYFFMCRVDWPEVKTVVQNWNALSAEKTHQEQKELQPHPDMLQFIREAVCGLKPMPQAESLETLYFNDYP